MTYWMVACTVYLFIVTLGENVRFCRDDDCSVGLLERVSQLMTLPLTAGVPQLSRRSVQVRRTI
jgi:hypothetical protein